MFPQEQFVGDFTGNKNINLGSTYLIRNESWNTHPQNFANKTTGFGINDSSLANPVPDRYSVSNYSNLSEHSKHYQPIRSQSYHKFRSDEVRALQETINRLNQFEKYVTADLKTSKYGDTINRLNKLQDINHTSNSENPDNFSYSDMIHNGGDVLQQCQETTFKHDKPISCHDYIPNKFDFNECFMKTNEKPVYESVDDDVERNYFDFKRFKNNMQSYLQNENSNSNFFNRDYLEKRHIPYSCEEEINKAASIPNKNTCSNYTSIQNGKPLLTESPNAKNDYNAAINAIITRHLNKVNCQANNSPPETTKANISSPLKYFTGIDNNQFRSQESSINSGIDQNAQMNAQITQKPSVTNNFFKSPLGLQSANNQNIAVDQSSKPASLSENGMSMSNQVDNSNSLYTSIASTNQAVMQNLQNNLNSLQNYNLKQLQNEKPLSSNSNENANSLQFGKPKEPIKSGKLENFRKQSSNNIDYQAKYYQLLNEYHRVKEQMNGKSTTDALTAILTALDDKRKPEQEKHTRFTLSNDQQLKKATTNNAVNTTPVGRKVYHEMGIQTDEKNPNLLDKNVSVGLISSSRQSHKHLGDPLKSCKKHHHKNSAIYVDIPDGNSHSFSETFSSLSTPDNSIIGEKKILTKIKKYLHRVLPKVGKCKYHFPHIPHNRSADNKPPAVIDAWSKQLCERKIRALRERQKIFSDDLDDNVFHTNVQNMSYNANNHECNLTSSNQTIPDKHSSASSLSSQTKCEDCREDDNKLRAKLIQFLYN